MNDPARLRIYKKWLTDRERLSDTMSVDNSRKNIINLAMTDILNVNSTTFDTTMIQDHEAVSWMSENVPKLETMPHLPRGTDRDVINFLNKLLTSEINYLTDVNQRKRASDGLPRVSIDRMNQLREVLKKRLSESMKATLKPDLRFEPMSRGGSHRRPNKKSKKSKNSKKKSKSKKSRKTKSRRH